MNIGRYIYKCIRLLTYYTEEPLAPSVPKFYIILAHVHNKVNIAPCHVVIHYWSGTVGQCVQSGEFLYSVAQLTSVVASAVSEAISN